jgi:hypothetical protein
MGLEVGISRFLAFPAPESISSRCARVPGGYELVFATSGRGASLPCVPGRRFNTGLLQDISRRSLAPVTVFSARLVGMSLLL